MDQLIIDVGKIKNIKIGEEVVLIGKQKDKRISTEELAQFSGTIPYEIVCGFNSRIPRIYRVSSMSSDEYNSH
jgi:alanine racemase